MSLLLRIILTIVSILTVAFMMKKIRNSKIQIEYSLFWIGFSAIVLLLSIFPQIADYLTGILGIYSTVNFIFLVFIFVLIVKLFLMTIKISQLDNKIRELTQKIAISEFLEKENKMERN